MELVIRIRMDNAAFDPEPGPEVCRILRQLADLADRELIVRARGRICVVRDVNGNAVGSADVR